MIGEKADPTIWLMRIHGFVVLLSACRRIRFVIRHLLLVI